MDGWTEDEDKKSYVCYVSSDIAGKSQDRRSDLADHLQQSWKL